MIEFVLAGVFQSSKSARTRQWPDFLFDKNWEWFRSTLKEKWGWKKANFYKQYSSAVQAVQTFEIGKQRRVPLPKFFAIARQKFSDKNCDVLPPLPHNFNFLEQQKIPYDFFGSVRQFFFDQKISLEKNQNIFKTSKAPLSRILSLTRGADLALFWFVKSIDQASMKNSVILWKNKCKLKYEAVAKTSKTLTAELRAPRNSPSEVVQTFF